MENYTTSDLALAAYLTMKGLELVSACREDSGRFEFVMKDPETKAQELSLAFFSSEFSQYDNQVRALKKLLYSR